jgi:FlaA1/EpsC-like NDP-sugar epimerase
MKTIKRVAPIALLVIWDIISVTVSVTIAIRLRFPTQPYMPLSYTANLPSYIVIFSLLMVIISVICGCYSGVLKHVGLNDAVRQLIAVVISCGAFFTVDRMMKFESDFTIFIIMGSFLFMFTIIGRAFSRIVLSARAKIISASSLERQRRILIYGAGEAGVHLKMKLDSHVENMEKAVVFIDDDESVKGKRIRGIHVYGGKDKLTEAIKKYNIDEVIVAIPTASRELLKDIFGICSEARCRMRRFGTIDDVNLDKVQVSNINFEDLLRRDSVKLNMEAVNSFVKDKVVMVTGGCGSIGSEICRQVLKFGCKQLIIFDIHENGLFFINNELIEKYGAGRHITVLGSIRDRARLKEVMDRYQPQVVFHAAAHKHVPMMEINPKEAI